jgi:hypothetical protein
MYNQPFSQPPGMFGAQSAMAQMQSAPSLPAGNPSAREYFNYSMATLSNAAMPRAMMPQGISSLVPQYQSGGDVGSDYGYDPGSGYGDPGSDYGYDPGSGYGDPGSEYGYDPGSGYGDPGSDYGYDPGSGYGDPGSEYGYDPGTSYGTSNPDAANGGSDPGFDPGTSYGTSNPPPPSIFQSALNFIDEYAMPGQRGPGILAAGLGPLSFVPALVSFVSGALGLKGGDFGEFDSDVAGLSTPSWRTQEETDEIIRRSTPPDTGDPDLGDPQQAAAAVAPTYVPPVYRTYAGLGLPSISPIPPLRRVTVPISSFVV